MSVDATIPVEATKPHRVAQLFNENGCFRFFATTIFLMIINCRVLTMPPYWDAVVGMYNQASWLEQHNFDVMLLQKQPVFNKGGPNVRPLNVVILSVALLYRVLPPVVLFAVMHLATIASASLILTLFYGLLREYLRPPEAFLWCLAGAVNPIFSGQTASLYLEIPAALVVTAAIALIARERFVAATLVGLVGFFIKESFALFACAIVVFVIYRIWTAFLSKSRYWDSRVLSLLIVPGIQLYLAGLQINSGSQTGSGTRVMHGLGDAFSYASMFFPDQAVLLCLSLLLAPITLLMIHRNHLPNWQWMDVMFLLGTYVVGSWTFYLFLFRLPLCRYFTMTVLPLMAIAGLLCSHVLGRRASSILACAAIAWGVLNSHGLLLPELPAARARSGERLERSREYLTDQLAMIRMCKLLQEKYADTVVVAKYPFLQMLTMPEIGYVDKPLPHVAVQGLLPSYLPVGRFEDMDLSDKVTFLYSPTSYEPEQRHGTVPPPKAELLFADDSLNETLIAYQLPASEFRPTTPELLQMAAAAQVHGQREEAARLYTRVLKREPLYAMAHVELGFLFLNRNPDRAVTHLKAAIELLPKDGGIHYHLGSAYEKAGKLADAIRHYRNALSLQPDLLDARNRLEKLQEDGDLEPSADDDRDS